MNHIIVDPTGERILALDPALAPWARAHKADLLALARSRATSGTVALGLHDLAALGAPSAPPGARHILGTEAAVAARLAADRLRRELPLDLRVQRCTVTGLPLEWGDHVRLVRLDSRGQAHPVGPPRRAADPEALIIALRGDLAALTQREEPR